MTTLTPKDDPEAVVHRSKIEAMVFRWIKEVYRKDEGGWDYIVDVAMNLLDLTKEELDEIKERACAEREREEDAEYERWTAEDAAKES